MIVVFAIACGCVVLSAGASMVGLWLEARRTRVALERIANEESQRTPPGQ